MVVLIEDIVDVREGQNSDGFDRYPYSEVEKQSFSVLVEGEMQGSYSDHVTSMILHLVGQKTISCAKWQQICCAAVL